MTLNTAESLDSVTAELHTPAITSPQNATIEDPGTAPLYALERKGQFVDRIRLVPSVITMPPSLEGAR